MQALATLSLAEMLREAAGQVLAELSGATRLGDH
jgi:hypothetical protein